MDPEVKRVNNMSLGLYSAGAGFLSVIDGCVESIFAISHTGISLKSDLSFARFTLSTTSPVAIMMWGLNILILLNL